MAIYRTVQLSFWTDPKVLDDFTPEDKYFYLYLFTNPQTNLCGCYELGWTATTGQLGYNRDTVLRLLDRFENVHKVIKYSKDTKEVLILNWHKYNWTKSSDFITGLNKQIELVKCKEFRDYLCNLRDGKTVCRPSVDGVGTSVTVTVNNTDTVTDSVNKELIANIVNYLNTVVGTNYKANSKNTVRHISARLSEGYTEQDFYTVIDKMFAKWGADEKMAAYLRPETLFGSKFESYLNMKVKAKKSEMDEWAELLGDNNDGN